MLECNCNCKQSVYDDDDYMAQCSAESITVKEGFINNWGKRFRER